VCACLILSSCLQSYCLVLSLCLPFHPLQCMVISSPLLSSDATLVAARIRIRPWIGLDSLRNRPPVVCKLPLIGLVIQTVLPCIVTFPARPVAAPCCSAPGKNRIALSTFHLLGTPGAAGQSRFTVCARAVTARLLFFTKQRHQHCSSLGGPSRYCSFTASENLLSLSLPLADFYLCTPNPALDFPVRGQILRGQFRHCGWV
jgi:hypothetical protein